MPVPHLGHRLLSLRIGEHRAERHEGEHGEEDYGEAPVPCEAVAVLLRARAYHIAILIASRRMPMPSVPLALPSSVHAFHPPFWS